MFWRRLRSIGARNWRPSFIFRPARFAGVKRRDFQPCFVKPDLPGPALGHPPHHAADPGGVIILIHTQTKFHL